MLLLECRQTDWEKTVMDFIFQQSCRMKTCNFIQKFAPLQVSSKDFVQILIISQVLNILEASISPEHLSTSSL